MNWFWKKAAAVSDDVVVVPPCDCKSRQQEYINDVDKLQREIHNLGRDKAKAEEKLAKVELDHKMKVEDIKHMQKMLDEKAGLDLEKATFAAEKAATIKIEEIKAEYTTKMETDLKEQQGQVKDMVDKIMTVLPNVNVQLGQPQAAPAVDKK